MAGRLRFPEPVRRAVAWFEGSPDVLLYLGVVTIVGGFGLVAYGWGRVAALHDVGLQMPYLASTCFTGAGLVMCGVALVLIGVRKRDTAARLEQLDELASVLRGVHEALRESETGRAPATDSVGAARVAGR